MQTRTVTANDVRIPEPIAGEVVVVERYGKPYAAIIDPASLELFQRMLAMFDTHRPSELSLSATAIEAHRASEAGEDIEPFDFGLLDTHPAG